MTPRSLFAFCVSAVVLCWTNLAAGQGADNCAQAQLLTAYGTYPFNTNGATTDGTANALCSGSGNQNISNDVWFRFRAPETFIVAVETCGLTSLNTKIAVYGSPLCTAAVIACSDDACATQSRVTFDAVKGQTYLIRIGASTPTGFGTGSIRIAPVPVIASATNSSTGTRYVLVWPTANFTWLDAVAYAPRLGGSLVSIGSQAEQDFVTAFANSASSAVSGASVWVGLNDRAIEGVYEWSDGTPMAYANWALGQPDNLNKAEDCAELYTQPGAGGKWNDFPCSGNRPAIIEIPSPTILVDIVNQATGRRYVGVGAMTWAAAEGLAVAMGGHLVSIGSPAEQGFVQSSVGPFLLNQPWIGLSDRALEGTFVWSDGTPLGFTNWATGEPNNTQNEDGVLMTPDGRWNDFAETALRPALIELPAPTPIPCPADLDGDRSVTPADLSQVLAAWGTASRDIDGDGTTGSTDLAILLANWGACP